MAGQIYTHCDFHSNILGAERTVLVYTPPRYDEHPHRSYPVLYLHDGQNIFDGNTSYVPGQHWEMREAADRLIEADEIEPLLIVAVYHAGEKRIDEYTPTPSRIGGGLADNHSRMIVEELRPYISSRYRVLPHIRHTGVGGSSLGGLASLHMGLKYPTVFGKLAVMSPSIWWDKRVMLRRLVLIDHPHRPKIWLDIGTAEGTSPLSSTKDVRLLRDILVSKGWRLGTNLHYHEAAGADHSERAWAARVPLMLKFLYPRKKERERTVTDIEPPAA